MSNTFSTITVTKTQGGWAEITFNRPDVLNALNLRMVTDFGEALDMCAADESVRGLILTGAGDKAFVAGADISELLHREAPDALRAINADLFQKLEDFPRPTIAAIRGYCLGGGCELALASDIRIAAEDAVFGQPEVKLGIIPGAGAPHRLTRVVGTGRARELIFTGRMVHADEALRIGLINHAVPGSRVMDEAREMMTKILRNGDLAVRLSKLALNAAANSVDRKHRMIEILSQGMTFDSDDKRERMTKFLERKKAKEQEGKA